MLKRLLKNDENGVGIGPEYNLCFDEETGRFFVEVSHWDRIDFQFTCSNPSERDVSEYKHWVVGIFREPLKLEDRQRGISTNLWFDKHSGKFHVGGWKLVITKDNRIRRKAVIHFALEECKDLIAAKLPALRFGKAQVATDH